MEKNKRFATVAAGLLLVSVVCWVLQGYFSENGDRIEAAGTIEATTVELNTKQAGTIKTLFVKTGDSIKKGQPVAELSRNDLAAQRERDELSVLKAQAALDDLMSGARDQEVKEARANANIARANYERTSDDMSKAQALFDSGAIAQIELDRAKTSCEISKNQLEAAEARLSLVESGSRPEQIEAARTEVERSKAVLKATEAILEDLNIYSPLDGVIISKNYEEGEYVPMGASLATLANMEDLWIKVYIPTDDLPQIRLGQKVSFSVSGIARSFEGVVEEIATKGEFTPKTIQTKKERTNIVFAVKIGIKSEDGILKPGMPADVIINKTKDIDKGKEKDDPNIRLD